LLVTLLLIVNIFPVSALAQTTADARIKRVEQGLLPVVLIKGDPCWSIAERMKFYKVPALSIAVIKDFKIEWAKAYGVTDLETGEPATTETLFQAGSISKSVNATVLMKKVEQGRISLDEDINHELTSWKLPDNEFTATKKVTLRNLLSHTASPAEEIAAGDCAFETQCRFLSERLECLRQSCRGIHDEWREGSGDCKLQEVIGVESAERQWPGDVEKTRPMSFQSISLDHERLDATPKHIQLDLHPGWA